MFYHDELTEEDIKILSGFGDYKERDSENAVKICKEFKVSENRKETRLWEGFIKSTRRVPSAMRNIIGGISS